MNTYFIQKTNVPVTDLKVGDIIAYQYGKYKIATIELYGEHLHNLHLVNVNVPQHQGGVNIDKTWNRKFTIFGTL